MPSVSVLKKRDPPPGPPPLPRFPTSAVSRFLSHTSCPESPLSAAGGTVALVTSTLGYARVSTTGQDLNAQLDALHAAGVAAERIYTDTLSGATGTHRPGLAALLDYARDGDTAIVTAIDRLGRSVAEVTRTSADLGQRGILLRALREGVDTATPTGRAVAAIMATLAELELELGRERRAASRHARRTRGVPATKPPKLSPERQEQLRRRSRHRRTRRRTRRRVRHRPRHRLPLPHATAQRSTVERLKVKGHNAIPPPFLAAHCVQRGRGGCQGPTAARGRPTAEP
jgi:DNA invertase Pin-like site-specific DNA recombinase